MTILSRIPKFKKILIMLTILLVITDLILLFYPISISTILQRFQRAFKKDEPVIVSEEKPSVFQVALEPIYSTPTKIVIDSIKLELNVYPVGVDPNGYLETPTSWNTAGWYKQSAKPSEVGNMLIDGHYDDNYGRPAAFWKLKNLIAGDKVAVLDSYGRSFDYLVVDSYFVDINDPGRMKILEEVRDKPILTLITCGGVWVPGQGTYNKRLIVSAELVRDN